MTPGQLKEIAEGYHRQLLESEPGLDYYRQAGVSRHSLKEFQLGWVTEPLRAGHQPLVGTPVTPYLNAQGTVNQLRFNAFEWDEAGDWRVGCFESAYPLDSPEVHLFNVGHALPGLRSNEVVLVEDVRSAVLMRQLRARVVGVPGYVNFYEPWYELLGDSSVILVCNEERFADARYVMRQMRRRNIEHHVVMLPETMLMSQAIQQFETLENIRREFGTNIREDDDD